MSILAVPLIAELGEGVFKHLIIKDLSERTGLDSEKLVITTGLDCSSDQERTIRTDPVRSISQRQLRLSKLAEYALQILLRQPSLATFVEDHDLSRLDGRPEWQILVEVVKWVQGEGDTSTMLLLSHYHDSPYFAYLKQQ